MEPANPTSRRKWAIKLIFASIIIIFIIIVGIALSIRDPTITVDRIRLENKEMLLSFKMPEYIKLKLTFTIHNPNIIGGTLKKVDADVYLNDVFVGPAYTTEHFDIRAAGDSKIEIHLIVTKPQDMPEQLLPLKIKALGKAIITVFFSDFEIPFDKTETVI